MLDQPLTSKMIAEKDGAIGRLIFNNPARHNAVSLEMWQAVAQIMDDFDQDDAIRVIVLSGAGGRAFVSGADISEFKERRASEEAAAAYSKISEGARMRLQETLKPTIAMIRGYCIGGGVGTALACDMRIAAEGSKFGVPAAKLGLGYAYDGIKKLVDLVGPAYAREIFFTARQFTAEEALRMGLVNQVVPDGELESLRQELLRHDRGECAVDGALGEGEYSRGAEGRVGARSGTVQASGRRMLRQHRLRRRPHRLHGKAQADVPRAVIA